MLTKSLGHLIIEKFCNEHLTVPILARAMGEHLGAFEARLIRDNNPTRDDVAKLSQLSEHASLFWGTEPYTPRQIWEVVATWDIAKKDERERIREGWWEEPPVLQVGEKSHLTTSEWLKANPVFTIKAFKVSQAHNVRHLMGGVLEDFRVSDVLHTMRWNECVEMVNGQQVKVWRWNPLKLSRPQGYVPPRAFGKRPVVPTAREILVDMKRRKIIEFLQAKLRAGIRQVTPQEVAKVVVGRTVNGQGALQSYRQVLASLGWVYDGSKRAWVPK